MCHLSETLFRDSLLSSHVWVGKVILSLKSSVVSATLHQGWRLPLQLSGDVSVGLIKLTAPGPHTQQQPIINKSNRKEAFVTVYLHRFSSSPLISSSENWCTLKLKQRAWQVMVSVITAQISSARVFFSPFFSFLCVQLLELWARSLDYLSSSASDKNASVLRRYSQHYSR